MAADEVDTRNTLGGRPTVPIPPLPGNDPVAHLSQRIGEGLRGKSLLVLNDGTVQVGEEFDTFDLSRPNVHTYIRGGTDFRCEPSGWLHDTLVAAGYTCDEV